MKFCRLAISSQATLATKFLSHTHRHKDTHFPEIVKSCSGHPKTCKSIENRKSKICTKLVFSSTYIEESNELRLQMEWHIYHDLCTTKIFLNVNFQDVSQEPE